MPYGEVVPAAQCFELGRRWYEGRMDPAWTRPSVEDMERTLDAVGLTSSFWSLRDA